MSVMKLTKDSMVKMHALQQRQENEQEMLIGRPDTGNYIILPTFAVDIIHLLDSGLTINQVEQEMNRRLGEPVDVLDFVNDLASEYQFVYMIDGTIVNEKAETKDHFRWISERVGNLFFNRLAYTIYLAIIISGMGIIVFTGNYFPQYSDIFIHSSLSTSLLAAILAAWFFMFLHEMAHLMAARSLGIGSRIGLSHRLFFAVAETNMSNIVLVPANKRYRAFFAGMAWDGTFFSVGVWLLFFHDLEWLSLSDNLISFLKMLNLNFLMALGFQFMFFMKTDIYYAFTTSFNCVNLLENTQLYLRKLIRTPAESEREEWDNVAPHEKRIVAVYSLFYLAGIAWAVYFFLAYYARQIIEIIMRTREEIRSYPLFSWQFLDGILVIILILVPFVIVIWSWTRSWMENRRRERHAELSKNI